MTTDASNRSTGSAGPAPQTQLQPQAPVLPQAQPPQAPQAKGSSRRTWAIGGLLLVFLVAGVAFGAHWWLVGQFHIDTDDAYVQGNVVQITPQVGGTALEVLVDDTQFVKAGQPLVRLDPADAEVALEQAKAQLAQTVREVRVTFSNNGALNAAIQSREADIQKVRADAERTRAELKRAQDDLNRRSALAASGAVSGEELQHARSAVSNARAALAASEAGEAAARSALVGARGQLATNQALTDGTTVENHPNVQRAASRVREATLALDRVVINAPVSGYVARRAIQVGQRVAAGTPMMAVIPLNQVWVDANFKESQLRDIRIGQPVDLVADAYGKRITYQGRISGLSAGTGSAFAILPAQNATGNWIKIVQRVPIRVSLDPKQIESHPLRVGLSMLATVDTHDRSGATVAANDPSIGASSSAAGATAGTVAVPVAAPAAALAAPVPVPAGVVAAPGDPTQRMIDQIIADHMGQRSSSSSSRVRPTLGLVRQ